MLFRSVSKNMIVVNDESSILPLIKNKSVIILCTWLIQLAFAEFIPNKTVWYDILDRIDFFSCYDEDALITHNHLVEDADIVTYSARNLKPYTNSRSDAIYLPNATKPDNFINVEKTFVPEAIKAIVGTGNPIIGYFGAIEEWFDDGLLTELAKMHDNWQFVLIGKASEDKKKSLSMPNVYLLGGVEHAVLASYAQHFDVFIIPFKVNSLTNSVSPVKLFEYASLGKPIVSTPIEEVRQYQSKYIRLAKDAKAFGYDIAKCLSDSVKSEGYIPAIRFANDNTWAKRADVFEETLDLTFKGLQTAANIDNSGNVAVMTRTFFDLDGYNFLCGGAERYLYDLHNVFKRLGIRMLIYQNGDTSWVRRFENIDVISLYEKGSLNTDEEFSNNFYAVAQHSTLFNIYSAYFTAYPMAADKSIGISHGVAWDTPMNTSYSEDLFWNRNKGFIESAKMLDLIVSVDTNTANWFQTIDYDTSIKMKVIPNYVDLNIFTPKDTANNNGRTVILYPRRLYEARGLYLMLDIVDRILSKYSHVDFHFVGRGYKDDTDILQQKIEQWGNRIQWFYVDMLDMADVYKASDIVVIPTMYSEGTSLSCLEAMATGNAVVATRVGGLTDLIINGYNGLLIDPKAEELQKALEDLLENPSKLQKLQRNALEVSKEFSKTIWENKWIDVINSTIDSGTIINSKPWNLVEVYLRDADSLKDPEVVKHIRDFLFENALVYVKVKSTDRQLSESYGRLQFLDWNEEVHSKPDYVVAYEGCEVAFGQKADLIIKG